MEGSPIQILFVEDNDDHAELTLRSLTEHRLANDIHRVSDGEQALDYLFRRRSYENPSSSPRPGLILLDLRLPKVDGLEVLRQIKADDELKRIPVVVLTTSEAEADVARAYDCHANAYIVKPVDFDKFQALMRDLGLFWLAWNKRADH
jgi:two-component system response regulator